MLSLTQEGLRLGYEKSTVSGWGKMFTVLETFFHPAPGKAKKAEKTGQPRRPV